MGIDISVLFPPSDDSTTLGSKSVVLIRFYLQSPNQVTIVECVVEECVAISWYLTEIISLHGSQADHCMVIKSIVVS